MIREKRWTFLQLKTIPIEHKNETLKKHITDSLELGEIGEEADAGEVSDLINDAFTYDKEFNVEQPHYGWQGFDEKHYEREVDALIKGMIL